jgi:hypothetical protein
LTGIDLANWLSPDYQDVGESASIGGIERGGRTLNQRQAMAESLTA